MLSHRNLMAMTVARLADFDSPDEECSLVHGAPMSHGSGLYIAPYVLRGARQVVPASGTFEPAEFLDLCGHHPGASAFLAPTMVQRLVRYGNVLKRELRDQIGRWCRWYRTARPRRLDRWSVARIALRRNGFRNRFRC
jgi:fatty-acyl-CoA synthase